MRTEILKRLEAIEKEWQVKILYACESGSRGWGFPSPDSDYDVRFIYMQPYTNYLRVSEPKDSLDFAINEELDINGWDLRKALRLTGKSNTTVFEWLQSPVVYREDAAFRGGLWKLCQHYFCPKSNAFHYLGIAKGALDGVSEDGSIKIKKLFYVLRPLLAAQWCVERNTIAPMNIKDLKAGLPAGLSGMVDDLILQKESTAEGFMINIPEQLKAWIDATILSCTGKALSMDKDHFSTAILDDFFRKTIQEHDDTGTER